MAGRQAAFAASGKSIGQVIERAQLAESLGYEAVWTVQVADREATIVAAAAAAATQTIKIGIGVLPIYPRTPVVMAQTAATIDELSEGRFILGLGPSHKLTIEMWHNMALSRPLQSMREYVGAVRAILQGQPYFGEIYKTTFGFAGYEPTRRDLPIYISCLSPKMCRLAGEVADGAVLWMCAPTYIRDVVVPAIAEGRRSVGKTMEGFEIVSAVPVAITENKDEAREAFRRVAIVYWNLPFYRAAIAGAGFAKDIETFDQQGPSGISNDTIDAFAGVGSKEECAQVVERYRSCGVTLPSISTLPAHPGFAGAEKTLEALA